MSLTKESIYEQTKDAFSEIGRFIVCFEHVIDSLRHSITFLLHKSGLKNQQLAHIILAELTAAPLRSILQAMIPEVAVLDEHDRKIVDSIFKRVQDLIERRNDVVHGTWFVGLTSEDGEGVSQIHGHKLIRGKSGSGVKGFNYTKKDFMALTQECDHVAGLVDRLYVTVSTNGKVSEKFVINGKDVLLRPV